jgi:hypothetical protein
MDGKTPQELNIVDILRINRFLDKYAIMNHARLVQQTGLVEIIIGE